jgi:hypothetical protein
MKLSKDVSIYPCHEDVDVTVLNGNIITKELLATS